MNFSVVIRARLRILIIFLTVFAIACVIKCTEIWAYMFRVFYSVLVSVSCPKALFHLESDNLFRITVVVADWLG